MVLLCNTLDFTVSLSEEISSSTNIHGTEKEKSERERSPIPLKSFDSSDPTDVNEFYELEDLEEPVHRGVATSTVGKSRRAHMCLGG
jgi:hypothetical protein